MKLSQYKRTILRDQVLEYKHNSVKMKDGQFNYEMMNKSLEIKVVTGRLLKWRVLY